MAMGDMQGIVEDESDYINDISSLLRTNNYIEVNRLADAYKLSDTNTKQNDFDSFNGNKNISSLDSVFSLSSYLKFFLNSTNSADDNKSVLTDSTFSVSTANVKTSLQFYQTVFGLGYIPSKDYVIGLGVESFSSIYDSMVTDPDSIFGNLLLQETKQKGSSYDQFYSIGYNGPKYYWGFTFSNPSYDMGSTYSNTDYQTGINDANYKIINTGAIRSNGILCVKDIMQGFNGGVDFKVGNFAHNTPFSGQSMGFFGFNYLTNDKKLMVSLGQKGITYNYPESLPASGNTSKIVTENLGIEYAITDYLTIMSGVRNKNIEAFYISSGDPFKEGRPNKLFYDYSFGISYKWGDIDLELAGINYQGRLVDYDEFKTASLSSISEDNILLSDQRNWMGAFGLVYKF
jgi:hypothetical protein